MATDGGLMTSAIRYVPLLGYAMGFVTVPVVRAVRNRLMNRAISERNRNRAAWARALSGSDLPNMDETPPGTTDALPNMVTTAMTRAVGEAAGDADAAYSPEERRGLLAFLRRKVKAKRQAALPACKCSPRRPRSRCSPQVKAKRQAALALAPKLRRFMRAPPTPEGARDGAGGGKGGSQGQGAPTGMGGGAVPGASTTFSTSRSVDENAAAIGDPFDEFDRRLGQRPDKQPDKRPGAGL